MAGEARATTSGAYVELDPANTVRATTSGAYVELDPINAVRATTVGAYVELLPKHQYRDPGGKPPKPPKQPKNPGPKARYRSIFGALAAWWPAVSSVGSSVLIDMVGNNNASMQGTVSWLNLASYGPAVDLPGVAANYFNAGASPAICDADMSVACWVKFDTVPNTTDERHNIIGRYTAGSDSYTLGLRCPLINTGAYVYWELGGELVLSGTYHPIYAGDVYHIVVSGEGGKAPGTWSLYINGELVETSGYSGAIPFQSNDTYIGRVQRAGEEGPLDAQIIDLQLYNRPLTPAEVAYLFNPITRWDAYKPSTGWTPGESPFFSAGSGLTGLSGLSGLSGVM